MKFPAEPLGHKSWCINLHLRRIVHRYLNLHLHHDQEIYVFFFFLIFKYLEEFIIFLIHCINIELFTRKFFLDKVALDYYLIIKNIDSRDKNILKIKYIFCIILY